MRVSDGLVNLVHGGSWQLGLGDRDGVGVGIRSKDGRQGERGGLLAILVAGSRSALSGLRSLGGHSGLLDGGAS